MSGPEPTRVKPDGAREISGPVSVGKAKPRRRVFEASPDLGNPGSFSFGDVAVRSWPNVGLQAKLVVRGTDDHWEREADANADAVVRALDGQAGTAALRFTPVAGGAVTGSGPGQIQRQEEEEEEKELLQAKGTGSRPRMAATETEGGLRALRGGGQGLPAGLRSEMEARFGADFGRVRVHAGSRAGDLAGRIGARAFTVGRDLVFSGGEYRPEDREGRRLLAHELTHVVQQTRPALVPVGGTVQRKAAAAPPAPRRALDGALKGDDDDVRELTTSKVWPGLDIKAGESATLMEHLLDGATVTEDEQAGIKVLVKAWVQNRIDNTLEELGSRSRFGQLLDDYHGAEYRELLSLLSNAIKKRKVKALYLDTFIAMWWLNQAEEEAVVILLEKSADAEVAALLKENNRLSELRSDIDDGALTARFELQVGQGNTADFDTVRKQLDVIFRVKAMFAVGSRTMRGTRLKRADVDRLLKSAAKDLARELKHYQAELVAAIPKGDTALVRQINDRFRARLYRLLAEKSYEFKLELRWNKEFNRALDRAFARNWTGVDLDKKRGELGKIDEMLRKIPKQFLYGSRDLREFRRGTSDPESPDTHGRAGASHITLFKGLDPGVTAHEVGHFIHRDAPKIFEEFMKKSDWELRTAAQLRGDGVSPEQIDELDRHRRDKKTYASVSGERFHYHWARYGEAKTYWRYRADAKFVSRYAPTDPKDDFAETFEAYIVRYEKDKQKAPEKFDFMRKEIFVKYWLRKEKERILDEFTDEGADLEDEIKDGRLRTIIWKRGGLPVKKALGKRLDDLATKKYDEVVKIRPREERPLERWPEAWKIGNGLITVLKQVYGFGAKLSEAFEEFKADARARNDAVRVDLRDAHLELVKELEKIVAKRLGRLIVKPRRLLMAGKKVKPKPWPALDVVVKKCRASLSVTGRYARYYRRHQRYWRDWNLVLKDIKPLVRWGTFDPYALRFVAKFPEGSVKHTILVAQIRIERKKLIKEFEEQKEELLERIRQGKKYRRGVLVEPKTMVNRYRSRVRGRFNKVKNRKTTTKAKGKRPQWF